MSKPPARTVPPPRGRAPEVEQALSAGEGEGDTIVDTIVDTIGDTHRARAARRITVADVKRSLVLAAARSAFLELGLEGTSLREIARRAGYSPGALYSYFANKEEVYGALLGESLERLNQAVHGAQRQAAATPLDVLLRTTAQAFFEFYRDHPQDLDLGFYLFQGVRPRGLTPRLNEALNRRLQDALEPMREGLLALGTAPACAQAEVTGLFAHIVGLLVLHHTQRIRLFRQDAQELFARYLDELVRRVLAPPGKAPHRAAGQASQDRRDGRDRRDSRAS